MASDDFNNDAELDVERVVNRFYGSEPSLRGLARSSGIPYSTLQAIKSGATKNPSQRTIDRIITAVENTAPIRKERFRTYTDDSEIWTANKLANLERPPGATGYRLVVRVHGTNTGVATTPWRTGRNVHPSDRLLDGDLDPSAIIRVVWDRG